MIEPMSSQTGGSLKQQLLSIRIIWGAMVMGMVVIACVFTFAGIRPHASGSTPAVMGYVPFFALPLVLVGFAVRRFLFARGRDESGATSVQAFQMGNIVCFAFAEGVTVIGLIFAFFTGPVFPTCAASAISFAGLLAAFPTGAALVGQREAEKIGNMRV